MAVNRSRLDTVDVKALGANGNGANADEFFLGAQLAVKARSRVRTGDTAIVGTTTIEIPAGDYTLTAVKAMLGLEAPTSSISGLRIRGAGSGLTNIIYSPTAEGPLMFNDYWQNIAIEGVSFITTYAGAVFMQSYTTHAAQKYMFTDVAWSGEWKYIFDLQGTNNNSEYAFYSCATSGMQDNGAFLYIGASGSDQFLNYWFYGFKHWSTCAAIIDAAYGGHFHFYGLDCSNWGNPRLGGNLPAQRYLFYLKGKSHAHGVQSLTVEGMRAEIKDPKGGILWSEWAGGNVSIECDMSSQVNSNTYEKIIHIEYAPSSGPLYNFHDSHLAGQIEVAYGNTSYTAVQKILVQNTKWHQKLTPSEVVLFEETAAGTYLTRPTVEFVNCRNDDNLDSSAASGFSVWDATVSNRSAVMALKKRSLKVGTRVGNIATASTVPLVHLPIGAIITGMQVLAPAGVSAEADGGTWTIKTTDGSPVTIASATVAGALSAGYRVITELSVPFLCNTRARASIKVDATNVSTSTYDALLLIEGYW